MAVSTHPNGRSAAPETAVPARATPGNGRDANGRFTKGNRGGSGNPFARQVAAFRKAIVEATTPEKIKAVVAAVETKALQGDLAAVKIYLAYTVGRPTAAPDPDALDVQEGLLCRQELELQGLMAKMMTTPLLGMLLQVARVTRPPVTDTFMAKLGEGLDGLAECDLAAAEEPEEEPPSANGGVGEEQAAGPEELPPSANGWDGGEPPLENGGNGAAMEVLPLPSAGGKPAGPATGQRPPRWVPPWEEAGGRSLPPFPGG